MPDEKGRMTPKELWDLEQSDYLAKQKATEQPKESAQPETSLGSKLNTVATRLGRVATLDFADEIGAGLKQAYEFNTNPRAYDSENYKVERDKIRDYFKKTAAENEGLDTAANVGGNIALALTPLGAIGKGMSVGKAALKAGALGAAQGAGESEEDSIKGVAKDAAIGGAISGGLGGATQALSKGLGAAGTKGLDYVKSKLAPKAAAEALTESGEVAAKLTPVEKLKLGAARFMGVNKEDAPLLLKNADDIARLQNSGTTKEQFVQAVKNNTKALNKLHKESIDVLSPEKNISKDSLHDVIDRVALKNRDVPLDIEGKAFNPKEVLGATDIKNAEKEQALNDVRQLIEARTQKNPNLSPRDLKADINKALDDMVSYEAMTANKKTPIYQNQIKEVRKEFDSILKTNPEYKAKMEQVAPLTKTQALLGKKFGVTKDINDETAFDMAAKKLELLQKNTKPERYAAEERILKRLDPNLPKDIQLRGLDERNVGGITRGSRNTNLGGITGLVAQHALGGIVGGAAGGFATDSPYGAGTGAVIGGLLDTHGREFGKKILLSQIGRQGGKAAAEATAKVANVPIEAAIRNVATPGVSKILGFTGTKFFEPLQQALAKGGSAYIEEDFKLSSDPEYRELKRRQTSGKTE